MFQNVAIKTAVHQTIVVPFFKLENSDILGQLRRIFCQNFDFTLEQPTKNMAFPGFFMGSFGRNFCALLSFIVQIAIKRIKRGSEC